MPDTNKKEKEIKLIMLTGFLGAGKTTMLKALLEEYKHEKIAVLINEFGAINIDAELVRQDGIETVELSNGSIFCACIKDKFVESLIQLSYRDVDYLFIEASGLADPASMPDILEGIRGMLDKAYDYSHAICIVDGTGFVELSEVLVALRKQVAFSDFVVVNKADLMEEGAFGEICEIIAELNPTAIVSRTSYCRLNLREMVESESGLTGKWEETTNSFESRPQTVILKERKPVDETELKAFLNEISGSAYRIKGFLNAKAPGSENGSDAEFSSPEGNSPAETYAEGERQDVHGIEVSCVGKQISVEPWDGEVKEGRLVVISSVGIRIVSVICRAMEKHLSDGSLSL